MSESGNVKQFGSWKNEVLKLYYAWWVLMARKEKVDRMNAESIRNAHEGNGEITIILHGILTNYYTAVYWAMLWFKKRNVNVVSLGFDYNAEMEASAKAIQAQIDRIRNEYNISKVHIIGISLGGGVARYYVEKCGGKEIVKRLVTICAPLRSPDPGEFTLAGAMENIFGAKDKSNASYEQTNSIRYTHSVEHLAIYGKSDWIVGKNLAHPPYEYPETTRFIQVSGGHLLVSYNRDAMDLALRYITEN